MRIGIFTECYHPILNGVVVSIDTFRKELESRGHKYFIFTTTVPGFEETDPVVTRLPCLIPFKPKGGRYPVACPQTVGAVRDQIKDMGLDLIHSQHVMSTGNLGLRVAKSLNLPAILTYHTLLAEYTHYFPLAPWLAKWYLVRKSRKVCNSYDYVVTPSSSMKRVLRKYGVTVPVTPIPTGVDLALFDKSYTKDEVCKKWKIPANRKILIYVSRVAKEKNIDFLFESLRAILSKRDDIHFLCIGGGPELKRIQALTSRWNVADKVTFTDMLPKSEVNRYYGACDVYVFASVTETQGIVIVEAMASGIPAVAVDQMGPSDIITDGIDGFLVPLKRNVFSGRIEQLLDNESLRKKMGDAARKNAQKFSTSACADLMEGLYEKVIDSHRS